MKQVYYLLSLVSREWVAWSVNPTTTKNEAVALGVKSGRFPQTANNTIAYLEHTQV